MSDAIEIGDLRVGPGEFGTGSLSGIELNNHVEVDVPVLAANGAEDGPTLLLFSTQHGTEIQGIEVVHTVLREELSPEDLRGAVIGVPVGNPLAYMHHQYQSWVDNRDVGTVSAESPDGNPTERLATALWEHVWSQADLVANLHCNDRPDSLLFQWIDTGNPETRDDLERMAEAYGVTTIVSDDPVYGQGETPSLTRKAAENGIPVILEELVDGRWISDPSRRVGVRGIRNVMVEFDMIDGEIRHPEEVPIVRCRYTGGSGVNRYHSMIRADRGGLLYPRQKPGDPIEAGEVVAEVRSLTGEVIEEIEMPADGYVWAYPCGQTFGTAGTLQTIETGGSVAYAFTHEPE